MKKINILYIVWIIALILFFVILYNLRNQGSKTIFGIAFTEHYSLNVEYATIVNERRVQPGDKVKKGDTLLILHRGEIDKNINEKFTLINQLEVEGKSKNELLDKEIELFTSNQNTRKSELQSEIKILEKEIEVQKNLLQSIGENKNQKGKTIKEIQVDGLLESLKQLNIQTAQQYRSFEAQRQSNIKNYEARIAQFKNDMSYYQQEQFKMIVLSPCDGMVEDVYVLPNDIAPQYKELVRINSLSPNRVTGFIHESVVTPFKLGDSVILVSAARPDITCKAIIIGNGNNLVELPLRLRKFTEIRAWGREVYIKMDATNNFYIGEKILVQIN